MHRLKWMRSVAACLLVMMGGRNPISGAQERTAGLELFADAPAADAPASTATAVRERFVTARFDLFDARGLREPLDRTDRQLVVNLFPDVTFTATLDSVTIESPRAFVWIGHLEGDTEGLVTFALRGDVMAGEVRTAEALYEIRFAGGNTHVVRQVDPASFPPDLDPLEPTLDPAEIERADVQPLADDGSLVDVLVVYTPSARADVGGQAAIEALIDLAIANTNSSYANSSVIQRVRLVHKAEVAYVEAGPTPSDFNIDLNRLTGTADGFMDNVHALRETFKADLVALVINNASSCGLAWLMTVNSAAFAPNGFSVSDYGCIAGNLTLAHEMGHNMSLHHDTAPTTAPLFPYGRGYNNGVVRDVMAVSSAQPRLQNFSNPAVNFVGTMSPSGTADRNGALALNNTRMAVSNFRQQASQGPDPLALYRGGTWLVENATPKQWGFASDIAVPGDYVGDTAVDFAVFRPSEGNWYIEGQAPVQWGFSSDLPVPADYNGDGRSDIAVFRPANGTWYVRNIVITQFGLPGDLPVPGDYSGDGRADLAVFRPTDGMWHIQGVGSLQFGLRGDVPVPADYNGDGRVDIAVWRPGTGVFHVRNQFSVQWGLPGDLPLGIDINFDSRAELVVYRREAGMWFCLDPFTTIVTTRARGGPGDLPARVRPWLAATPSGDLDGDRRADVTVFRPSNATWYTRASSTSFVGALIQQLGATGDVPMPGDYRGIGRAQPTTFRPADSTWRILGGPTLQWGIAGDVPVAGDFDGDTRPDVAVWRPSTGVWYWRHSSTEWVTNAAIQFGLPDDVPLPGDYDGDRVTDLAVFRPSTAVWHILLSSSGFTVPFSVQWGLLEDVPVPADYDGDGRWEIAVRRPSEANWYVLWSTLGYQSYSVLNLGVATDTPAVADFDGDRRADLGVFRPSSATWSSPGNFIDIQWGLPGDISIPRSP